MRLVSVCTAGPTGIGRGRGIPGLTDATPALNSGRKLGISNETLSDKDPKACPDVIDTRRVPLTP